MRFRSLLLGTSLTLALFSGVTQAAEPIRVAIDPTFPPMEYMNNNQRTGFDIDLACALAKKIGRPLVYTDMDFKALIPSVLSGRQDIVLSAIYITDDRKKVVDFTEPYFSAGLVVMVKKDDKRITSPKALAGKRVAVQVGTKSVNLLTEQYPTVQRIEVEKNEEMFNALEAGRADAVVTGKPAAMLYSKTRGTTKVLSEPLTHEVYGIAVSKNEPDLRQQLNTALKAIRADGTYDAVMKKWFGTDTN